MRIRAIILMLVLGAAMISCTKNDETTLVLLGEEEYVEDILKVIPEDMVKEFNKRFGIYRGSVPPNIQGEYLFAPKVRKYTNFEGVWPLTAVEPNVYMKFMDQHNRVATFIHNEEVETKTDTIYVMGRDSYFTAYYVEDVMYDYGMYEVKMKRGIIYSGRVVDAGIKNLKYASVIMDIEDESGGEVDLYPVGTYFMYEDGSAENLAERYNWYKE